ERMLCAQFVDLAHQKRAHFRRLPDQIFLIDNFQRSQSTSHRQVVAPEGAGMYYTPVHARKRFLVNVAPGNDGAAWYVTAAQTLRDRNNVRLQTPMLKTEHLPSAPESGLHFIGNQ